VSARQRVAAHCTAAAARFYDRKKKLKQAVADFFQKYHMHCCMSATACLKFALQQ
jgi:dTDP-4-amino-4,6-dideoxygalactose transaminase